MYQERPCKCGSHFIVNKKFWLCDFCNYKRTHDGKTPYEVNMERLRKRKEQNKDKMKQYPKIKRNLLKSSKKRVEKRLEILSKDRELYLYHFQNKSHVCEECGCRLPDMFLDNNGNIMAIWQYSHILGKGRWPELRHHKLNINRLCLNDHTIWEHASEEDKKKMKIYKPNQEKIRIMLKEIGKWFKD